jgi:hypothetical protein
MECKKVKESKSEWDVQDFYVIGFIFEDEECILSVTDVNFVPVDPEIEGTRQLQHFQRIVY